MKVKDLLFQYGRVYKIIGIAYDSYEVICKDDGIQFCIPKEKFFTKSGKLNIDYHYIKKKYSKS